MQLRHALRGVDAVRQHDAAARRLAGVQLDEAIETVRALDERHAARLAAVLGEFYAGYPPHDRPVIAAHRDAVAAIVAECAAVAIAGGHVGVLTDCLHVCNLGAVLGDRPVVAWSSGAMAIAERVMIVDDHDLGRRPGRGVRRRDRRGPWRGPAARARRAACASTIATTSLCSPGGWRRVSACSSTRGTACRVDRAGAADLSAARVVAPDGIVRSPADGGVTTTSAEGAPASRADQAAR